MGQVKESKQLGLDWEPHEHARKSDKGTSHAAAHSVHDAKVLMARIHADLVANGPSTFSEIAQRIGLDPWRVTKRVSDLKNAKLVMDSSKVRKGPSGRYQTVWKAM